MKTMDGIVGMIKMVLTPNATAEWLPCDGRVLSATIFADLFGLIGHRFGGAGDEFMLPNVPAQEGAHFMIKVKTLDAAADYQGIVAQMVLWPTEVLPAGWLPCDGRLVRGADYPMLQKVAATGQQGITAPEFHLPMIPDLGGLHYMICVEGMDPNAAPSGGPKLSQDDDDY